MLNPKPAYKEFLKITCLNWSRDAIFVWLDINLLEMVSTGWKTANSNKADEAEPKILAVPEFVFLSDIAVKVFLVW